MSYLASTIGNYALRGHGAPWTDAGLGCGPSCSCQSCHSQFHGYGETYERDDDEDDIPPAAMGLHGTISVTDPATGRICQSAERRIQPAVEPPPHLLVPVAPQFKRHKKAQIRLHHAAYAAYLRLKGAAEADGVPAGLLTIISGYRSVAHQTGLWEAALRRYGSRDAARVYVAPPGGSPHHTGRAIDFYLGASNDSLNIPALRRTPAYYWLMCNAGRFGFTPYGAEPWHWEYNPPGLNPMAPPPDSEQVA